MDLESEYNRQMNYKYTTGKQILDFLDAKTEFVKQNKKDVVRC